MDLAGAARKFDEHLPRSEAPEDSSSKRRQRVRYLIFYCYSNPKWILQSADFLGETPAEMSQSLKIYCVRRTLSHGAMFIKLCTNSESSLSFSIAYDLSSINADTGILYAAFILLGLYVMIIFEVNHARELGCVSSCRFLNASSC